MTRTSKELLALALGFGFAACSKAKPPAVPSVAILSPADGGTLTADAGTVANGILTITVTAQTTGINDGEREISRSMVPTRGRIPSPTPA